ncbi:MAG: hypothetical protein ABSH20_11505 [Tepidisphaeraceae bacterium]|jgi:hypothetical protein
MKLLPGFCALLVLAFATTLHAESIGVNFVGKDAKAQTLEATQKAGVAAVAQDHWNHLTVSEDDANGHDNSGTLAKVNDNAGKEVKGAGVTVAATADTQAWPSNGASWGFTETNLILQSGMIWSSPTIAVKGIPYKNYAVYVYVAAGDNGGQGGAKISVANKVAGKVDPTDTYFVNFNWQGGNFVKSEAKTLAEAKASKGSNYICFTGNTASDITVDFNGTLGGGWLGVAAIQIVQIPEAR